MSIQSKEFKKGAALAQRLFGDSKGDFRGIPLANAGDSLPQELVTWLYGYLLQERSSLTVKHKVLCIIAMSTATNQIDMLRTWLVAAVNAGCTRIEVQEAILTMAIYGGWPPARKALETVAAFWPGDGEAATGVKA